jgi:hypothetical protein
MMENNKTYLVLTPEKIEDIFRDLECKLDGQPLFFKERKDYVKNVLESKKQELLKSIK